jgi:hypothetical protein
MTMRNDPFVDPREAIWQQYPDDAHQVPALAHVHRCTSSKCGALVWYGLTSAGKRVLFDVRPDTGEPLGTLHYRTCLDYQRRQLLENLATHADHTDRSATSPVARPERLLFGTIDPMPMGYRQPSWKRER